MINVHCAKVNVEVKEVYSPEMVILLKNLERKEKISNVYI